MRVLLPLHGFVDWNGGLDLVRMILSALDHPSIGGKVDVWCALPEPSRMKRLFQDSMRSWRSLHVKGQASTDSGQASALLQVARQIAGEHSLAVCADNEKGIRLAAERINADIVFPTMLPLGKSRAVRIGYLFDFQHRHMPHLFAARTRRNRDKRFQKIADASDGIVVNSRAAARDVKQFLGFPEDRVLAMPFTPYSQPWWFDGDPVGTRKRYGISHPYVLVCNHLWKHKDHATALRAFALLQDDPEYANMQLVLTGDTIDHRDPQHYARLVALGQTLGIARNTHYLGLIPKRDQLALLRGCSVLLQPTLFEGGPGGGSVYEAVGLGVPAVVSDIAINQEIDCGDVRFFQAGNPEQLAVKIKEAIAEQRSPPRLDDLLAQSDVRLSCLANAIVGFLDGFLNDRTA